MKDFQAFLGAVAMAAVAIIGGWLLSGWVLTILWGWFIVPTFGLPRLGIAPALGVSLVVGYLTRHWVDVKSPERTSAERWTRTFAITLSPLLSLGMGWVVHLFMGAPS